MNNDVVAPLPGAEEVETVAPAVKLAHSLPAADVTEEAPSLQASSSVAAELHKMFYWIAMR